MVVETINMVARQGSFMSPALFNLYLVEVIRTWKNRLAGLGFDAV